MAISAASARSHGVEVLLFPPRPMATDHIAPRGIPHVEESG